MTGPEIITALRAIKAPGSTHLDARLTRADIVALLWHVDALQADAERYQWLVNRPEGTSGVDVVRWDFDDGTTVWGKQMTQAIDAAMKEPA